MTNRSQKSFFIVGCGGHAQVCFSAWQAGALAGYEFKGWLEKVDLITPHQTLLDHPVLPDTDEQIKALLTEGCTHFVWGVGCVKSNPHRLSQYHQLIHLGFTPLTIIHPTANVAKNASIHKGVVISAGAIVQPFANIGEGSIINTGAIIEHHTRIGTNVHVAPGAILCGDVVVGTNSFIGAGSVVIQGIQIGENITIGAGETVRKDIIIIEDAQTTIGHLETSLI